MAAGNTQILHNGGTFNAEGNGAMSKSSAVQVTFKKVGLLSALKTEFDSKATGESYLVNGETYYIESMDLMPHPGGIGELTLKCSDTYSSAESPPTETADVYSEQIDMTETKFPLVMHKNFPSGGTDTWLKFLASPTDIQAQRKYREIPASDLSAVSDLPSDLAEWAILYNKGVREYNVYLPVARKVSLYKGKPSVGSIGKVESPSITVPDGYSWLKTGDSLQRNDTKNKWQRTETWTGAAEWPKLLYG